MKTALDYMLLLPIDLPSSCSQTGSFSNRSLCHFHAEQNSPSPDIKSIKQCGQSSIPRSYLQFIRKSRVKGPLSTLSGYVKLLPTLFSLIFAHRPVFREAFFRVFRETKRSKAQNLTKISPLCFALFFFFFFYITKTTKINNLRK